MGEAHAPSIPAVWCPEKWSTGAPHLRLSAAGEIELGNLRSIDPIHYALDLLKGHSDLLGANQLRYQQYIYFNHVLRHTKFFTMFDMFHEVFRFPVYVSTTYIPGVQSEFCLLIFSAKYVFCRICITKFLRKKSHYNVHKSI